ncbi:Mediator of RNA polymerase II transcription subunit 18 [Strongyloides ratti]|uniref:Mediator of RNA polymerase II transcription subunit 18 n=1 Tax=Strongyloides ratti TaxID=34506 RepID=A0A090MYA2_STRRB|nr:Mediator of RNA polymerase II transcription subunit 18 [Strongyloides ratti]CEF66829.1 Mediator of RNA polymerase II transcription subunit 18 [Strongyloides ratti]
MASIPSHQLKETKYNPLTGGKNILEDFKAQVNRGNFQKKEIVLYGSIFQDALVPLKQRLQGLCDPGEVKFREHEITFYLSSDFIDTKTPFVFRFRRKFPNYEGNLMHLKYIGTPELNDKCPCIVRNRIDTVTQSSDQMEFIRGLGLRTDYEFIVEGYAYTKGEIVITVYKLSKIEKMGYYDDKNVKPFSNSYLVEISLQIPYLQDYSAPAKAVRDFADQLYPIVEMRKVNYWSTPQPKEKKRDKN